MHHSPVSPHGPLEEIAADVFMVRGSTRMKPLGQISRNMAVIRHEGELTLIDPIRLNDAAEAELKKLGNVRRILRLGTFHGVDDRYYKDVFDAELWSQKGDGPYADIPIDQELTQTTALPFPNATLFLFRETTQPETALLIEQGPGLLLTCDAIQNYGDYSMNSRFARLVMPLIGFPKKTLIGPFWLRAMTAEGGSTRPDFERLLALDFDRLLSAHGTLLDSGAKAAVKQAFEHTFS
jgi:hypothetical protein